MPGDNWCLGDGRAEQEPALGAVGEPAGQPEPEPEPEGPEPRLPTPLEMRNELTELFAAHSGAAAFTVDYWGARLFFRATEGVVLGQLSGGSGGARRRSGEPDATRRCRGVCGAGVALPRVGAGAGWLAFARL